MPRLRSLAAATAAALLASACYRVTVVTAPAPAAAAAEVNKPFANGFIFGLVAPAPVDARPTCGAGGVSRVVTQRSFFNGLVGGLTFGIYTPMQITATCTAARTSSLDAPREVAAAPAAAVAPAAPAVETAPAAPAAKSAKPAATARRRAAARRQ